MDVCSNFEGIFTEDVPEMSQRETVGLKTRLLQLWRQCHAEAGISDLLKKPLNIG